MQEMCVYCQKTHPDSTKRNWKAGEVGGILEIIWPLDPDAAWGRDGQCGTLLLMGVIFGSLLGLTVLSPLGGEPAAQPDLIESRLRRQMACASRKVFCNASTLDWERVARALVRRRLGVGLAALAGGTFPEAAGLRKSIDPSAATKAGLH
jgi:hypothetical protein